MLFFTSQSCSACAGKVQHYHKSDTAIGPGGCDNNTNRHWSLASTCLAQATMCTWPHPITAATHRRNQLQWLQDVVPTKLQTPNEHSKCFICITEGADDVFSEFAFNRTESQALFIVINLAVVIDVQLPGLELQHLWHLITPHTPTTRNID